MESTHLFASFRGELALLEKLLHESVCTAALRAVDGTVIPVTAANRPPMSHGIEAPANSSTAIGCCCIRSRGSEPSCH